MTISEALAWAYSLEVNVRIHSFWDSGWCVWIGDDVNGYWAYSNRMDLEDVADEIVRLVKEYADD